MTNVECVKCGWTGYRPELDSAVQKHGLEKVSKCPECGAKSSNDYLKVDDFIP